MCFMPARSSTRPDLPHDRRLAQFNGFCLFDGVHIIGLGETVSSVIIRLARSALNAIPLRATILPEHTSSCGGLQFSHRHTLTYLACGRGKCSRGCAGCPTSSCSRFYTLIYSAMTSGPCQSHQPKSCGRHWTCGRAILGTST